MTLAPLDPKNSLHQERINDYCERRRQARYSFNLALGINAACAFVFVVGSLLLLNGHISEGSFTAATGFGVKVLSIRFYKDANDRWDKHASELKDE